MAERPLPTLDDEQLQLLGNVCKKASFSRDPPFKALSAALALELQEQGIPSSRDGGLFRWILRLCDASRDHENGRIHGHNRYVSLLNDVLQEQQPDVEVQDLSASEDRSIHDLSQSYLDDLEARAVDHDRYVLMKQAFGYLRREFEFRVQERQRERHIEDLMTKHRLRREQRTLRRALCQWAEYCRYRQQVTTIAQERHMLKKYFVRWRTITVENVNKAQDFIVQKYLSKWRTHLGVHRRQDQQAEHFRQLRLRRRAFDAINGRAQAEGALYRQAETVDRSRLLHTMLTSLSDAVRMQALTRRVNERLLFQSMQKLRTEQISRDLTRTQNARLLSNMLATLSFRTQQHHVALEEASATFAANQRQRQLRSSMRFLNMALRGREDAERRAVEFYNIRALPKALDVMQHRAAEMTRLNNMARDFHWYTSTKRCLKMLHERAFKCLHDRRAAAYRRVRTMIKVRQVKTCFDCLVSKHAGIQAIKVDAEQYARGRVRTIAINAIRIGRDHASHITQLKHEALEFRERHVLHNGISSLVSKHTELAAMEQDMLDFRHETDLDAASSALRKLQWATFTVQCEHERGDALSKKIQNQHAKRMLRHLAAEAKVRRAGKLEAQEVQQEHTEPESPSLRPASRLAARTPRSHLFSSPPRSILVNRETPAYMQTPSRSRRVVRFRQPLPTPAPVTPFTLPGIGN